MFNILLQFDSTAISTSTAGKESLFSLLVKGGVLMIPLAIFMAMAIFFFIERLIAIRKASNIEKYGHCHKYCQWNHQHPALYQ